MIALLSALFMAVINLLPSSPFQTNVDGILYKLDFLPYLNWFVPFDNCLKIIQIWLPCIVAYYLYDVIIGIVNRLILDKLG